MSLKMECWTSGVAKANCINVVKLYKTTCVCVFLQQNVMKHILLAM